MNFSEIRVTLPFFETEIWITPQRSHKCLFYSCKSPLPCLTWLQRKAALHHQIPSQWHTWNGTRAGIHMQGVDMFASRGVFLLFLFLFMSASPTSCCTRYHMRWKHGVMSPLAWRLCLNDVFSHRPEEREADISQNKIGYYLSSAVDSGAC